MALVHPEDNNPKGDVSRLDTNLAIGNPSIKGDVPRPDPSFMGKGQVDQFSSLTDPLSVDRGGRTIAREDNSTSLDPVGIKPAMNPPLATPTDNIDEQGVNSLY